MRYFDLIRLRIPQSALAFIFIGRGSHTPLQVGLYKNFQNKMKPTRITTGQTGQTGRPLNCQNWLSTVCEDLCAHGRPALHGMVLIICIEELVTSDLVCIFQLLKNPFSSEKNKTK